MDNFTETLREIFDNTGFIAVLLLSLAFIHMFTNTKVIFYLLLLILLSQIVLNWNDLERFLRRYIK